MLLRCPGCLTELTVDDEAYEEKVLLQCPECLFVFLTSSEGRVGDTIPARSAESPLPEDATVLTSDRGPDVDAREFQWNVPGASVTVVEGENQGIHRKLKDSGLIIGRKDADLVVAEKSVSRKHCEIIKKDGEWRITDLGSTNGTLLNGEKIEGEVKLHHLDEIGVGRAAILFAETEAMTELSLADREDEASSSLDLTKIEAADKEPDHPLPEGREFILEYMTGAKKGRSIKLEKSRVIIGRAEGADVVLVDNGVSRKHAMLEIHSRDQMYLSDLASQNGTWLNGLRIRTTRLILGDLIRMGGAVLKFVVQDVP